MKKGNILNNKLSIVSAVIISMLVGIAQNFDCLGQRDGQITVVNEYDVEKTVSVKYDSVQINRTIDKNVVKDVNRVDKVVDSNKSVEVNKTTKENGNAQISRQIVIIKNKLTEEVTPEELKESVLYDEKYSLKEVILEEKIAKAEAKEKEQEVNALSNIGKKNVVVELVEPKPVVKKTIKTTAPVQNNRVTKVNNVTNSTTTSIKKVAASKIKTSSVETKKVVTNVTNASGSDLMYLACIVFAEAGGESYQGKLAVANVVLNRRKSSRYPNTIYGVISQKGQFGPYRNGSLNRAINKYRQGLFSRGNNGYTQSLAAAKAALNGTNNIGARYSFNTTGPSRAIRIGHHKFW